LRRELVALGDSFITTGDTEVLLASWLRWGEASLDRFDAMFAFALLDGEELVLATDLFGEKPLYVASTEEGVWFASEPQALIETLKLDWQPDAEDIRHFLALGFLPPPRTGFRDLTVLPPGTIRRYRGPQDFAERRYWRMPATQGRRGAVSPLTEDEVDSVAVALVDSLRRRLRSDVPIGLFLSSGIDSALVAALCAKELNVPLATYTVAFPDGVDEAPAAKAIATHLGLPHLTIDSRDAGPVQLAPERLVDLYGVPNDNLSGLSVLQMSRLAKQYVTVALSGSGGDELAFGYNKYAFLWRRRNLFRLPNVLFRAAMPFDRILRTLPGWELAREYLAGDRSFRFLAVKNSGFASCLRRLSGGLPTLPLNAGEPAFSARDLDIELTLPGSYLSAIDRGSMRVGLEVRTPYLNRTVFERMSQIDPRALLNGDQKVLLRRILARFLPRNLYDRPKRGFVSPLAGYIRALPGPPSAPSLANDATAELWRERDSPAAANLLLRIGILETLGSTAFKSFSSCQTSDAATKYRA
jgi:asparagine synthase (glutamine-hydrolysing)